MTLRVSATDIRQLLHVAAELTVQAGFAPINEPVPAERIDGTTAHVRPDALITDSAAIVLFRDDTRLRAIMSCETLIAHADSAVLVRDFADALARYDGQSRMLSVSGPSKTADIEKKLVIGVHGPRSVSIVLYGLTEPEIADE